MTVVCVSNCPHSWCCGKCETCFSLENNSIFNRLSFAVLKKIKNAKMNQFKWLPMEIKPLHSHTDTHFHQGVCVCDCEPQQPLQLKNMGREEECAGLSSETRVDTMNDTQMQPRSSLNWCSWSHTQTRMDTCAQTNPTHTESLRWDRKRKAHQACF